VPVKTVLTAKELTFLAELRRHGVEFMIVGAAAAAMQGAPIVTQDVDLWFKNLDDPGIQQALRKVGGIFVPSLALRPPAFAGDAVEMLDIVLTMHGLGSFDEEKKHSSWMALGRTRVRVLHLDRVIKSKEAVRRPKDLLTIPVLKDALAVLKRRRSPILKAVKPRRGPAKK
jgi:hypothetical protein